MSTNRKAPVLSQLVSVLAMGGAENLAIQIANAHAEAGNKSHIIVLEGPGPLSYRINSNVGVHYLGYRRKSAKNPIAFLFSVMQGLYLLTRTIKKNNIDIIQTHLPGENLWGLVLAFTRKCTVVVTIHNNRFLGENKDSALWRFLLPRGYRQIFHYCQAVVACSEEVRNSILAGLKIPALEAQRVHVVTNGVLQPNSISLEKRFEIRNTWGVKPGETFLIGAGRFTNAKNFSCLIDAVGHLKTNGVCPKLIIGGDGPLRPELEAKISNLKLEGLVQLPGNIPDLQTLMLASDCLVMSSRWEGLPLVLLESMIRGLPVVGTKINGIADTIEDGVHGFLVEVDDPVALADAIAKIMKNPVLASSMGQNGKVLVEKEYSFSRVYNEFSDIYDLAVDLR